MFIRSISVRRLLFWPGLIACFAAVGCAAAVDREDAVASDTEALKLKAPSVPANLVVPDGNRLAFRLNAVGVQIYACQANTAGVLGWAFQAPEADLFNARGRFAGKHYKGPTWEGLDGSTVVGSKLAASPVDATAIPWLLLQATSHTGDGRMSEVTFIQRLNTVGGLAPSTGCDDAHVGVMARVDYTAVYYFYEASDDDC